MVGGEVDQGVLANLQLVKQVQQLAHGVVHLENAETRKVINLEYENLKKLYVKWQAYSVNSLFILDVVT